MLGSGTAGSYHAEVRKEFTFDDIINKEHDYFSKFGLRKPLSSQSQSPSQQHLLASGTGSVGDRSVNDSDNDGTTARGPIGRKRLFQWCVGCVIMCSFVCGLILLVGGIVFGILVNANVLDDYCVMQFEFKKQVPGVLNFDYCFTKITEQLSKNPFQLTASIHSNGTIEGIRQEALKNYDKLSFVIYEEGLSLIMINATSNSDSGVFDFGQNYRNIKQVIDSALGTDYLQRIVSGCN